MRLNIEAKTTESGRVTQALKKELTEAHDALSGRVDALTDKVAIITIAQAAALLEMKQLRLDIDKGLQSGASKQEQKDAFARITQLEQTEAANKETAQNLIKLQGLVNALPESIGDANDAKLQSLRESIAKQELASAAIQRELGAAHDALSGRVDTLTGEVASIKLAQAGAEATLAKMQDHSASITEELKQLRASLATESSGSEQAQTKTIARIAQLEDDAIARIAQLEQAEAANKEAAQNLIKLQGLVEALPESIGKAND